MPDAIELFELYAYCWIVAYFTSVSAGFIALALIDAHRSWWAPSWEKMVRFLRGAFLRGGVRP